MPLLRLSISCTGIALALLALTDCSGSPNGVVIRPGLNNRGPGGGDGKKTTPIPGILVINDSWVATARTCNGAKLDLDKTESFHFDATQFTMITQDIDASTLGQFCENAYGYNRKPTLSHTEAGTYTESASVTSGEGTQICWRINKGHVVRTNPISSNPFTFGPETFTSTITATSTATSTSMVLTLNKSAACPAGDLIYTLKKN